VDPAGFRDKRKVVGVREHFEIAVLRNAVVLKAHSIPDKGAERCIKLLAAWLLRRVAPYNCRFPEQN
jgi:hypothetical protein